MRTLVPLLMGAALMAGRSDSAVAAEVPEFQNVQVGFGGYYKVGKWTPLKIQFSGGSGTFDLLVETVDPEGTRQLLPVPDLEFPRKEPLELLFQSGRIGSSVTLRLREPGESGKVLSSRTLRPVETEPNETDTVMLKQNVYLLACWGDPQGFVELAAPREPSSPNQVTPPVEMQVVPLRSQEELSGRLRGYDGLDLLVITQNYDLPAEVALAIQEWVQAGGSLMITVGSEVEAWKQSPLSKWIPVSIEPTSLLTELSGLESFSGRNEAISVPDNFHAALLKPVGGQVLASAKDGPILVRVPYGFGQVIVCGIDLHQPPMTNWKALPAFLRNLLFPGTEQRAGSQQKQRQQLAHTGMTDLSSQLFAAQDEFPSVERYSNWGVMGWILVYLLLIGPVDYLLVHRLLKRPQLTWITFPILVAGAAGLAVWQARATNGEEFLVNQVEVIDIDASLGTARVQSIATIYSPESARYEIGFAPRTTGILGSEPPAPMVNWFGTPEDTFGGMYRPGGVELTQTRYSLSPGYRHIQNLPVAVWSTRTLQATWHQPAENLVESNLEAIGVDQLTGDFVHHLPVPIENWMIAYRNRMYRPRSSLRDPKKGALAPGVSWGPGGPDIYQRELKGYLTGLQARRERSESAGERDEIVVEQTRYDVLNRNPEDVLRMITFHQAAGGTSYTELTNTQFQSMDLSPLLQLDRAVLLGQITLPAAGLEVNGNIVQPTSRTCFIRLVIPVKQTGELVRELPEFDKNP